MVCLRYWLTKSVYRASSCVERLLHSRGMRQERERERERSRQSRGHLCTRPDGHDVNGKASSPAVGVKKKVKKTPRAPFFAKQTPSPFAYWLAGVVVGTGGGYEGGTRTRPNHNTANKQNRPNTATLRSAFALALKSERFTRENARWKRPSVRLCVQG